MSLAAAILKTRSLIRTLRVKRKRRRTTDLQAIVVVTGTVTKRMMTMMSGAAGQAPGLAPHRLRRSGAPRQVAHRLRSDLSVSHATRGRNAGVLLGHLLCGEAVLMLTGS